MMPAETLSLLRGIIQQAEPSKRIVAAPDEPAGVYYVAAPDGTLVKTVAGSPAYRHAAADLDTLAEWAITQADTDAVEVWYSRLKVTAGPAPGNPAADRCTVPLAPSPQFAYCLENERVKGVSYTQAELIRLLRTTLAGCVSGDFLAAVRKVNVSKMKAVESEIQKNKVSLGAKHIAEMVGAHDLPDELAIDVPVFAAGSIPARATVRAALELNPETERFTLIVLPGQCEAAYTKGEAWLATTLGELLGDKAESIPVYHGDA